MTIAPGQAESYDLSAMKAARTITDQTICIVGLGYVGLTLAVAMADSGFRVHGIEIRQDVLTSLARGQPHFWEPRLKEKLARVLAAGSFTFSSEPDSEFPAMVYIITVGTPIKEGEISLEAVRHSTEQVASVLSDGSLVILRSTVKLGTARHVVKPILETTGCRFDLAVCPERTLEGRALIELHELPQIIGADDPCVRTRCANLFGVMTPTTITLSSLEAAEMAKLVDNTYRDVMFAFANEIASVCGSAGLSALEIIRAGRLGYPRTSVALPGPVGGPCLEKDPHILADSALAYGVEMGITRAARRINEQQPYETAKLIREQAARMPQFPQTPRICLAGLAFKGVPATDDLRGTMAKPIHIALSQVFPDAHFFAFDPVVSPEAARAHFQVEPVKSIYEAFAVANIVVIMNNHPIFQAADIVDLARDMPRPGIIYDCWNMHTDSDASMPAGVRYMALGSERFQAPL